MQKYSRGLPLLLALLILLGLPIAALASTPIIGLYTEGTFHDDGSWSFNPIGLSTPRVLVSSAVRYPNEIYIWRNRETYLSWRVEEAFLTLGQSIFKDSQMIFFDIHLLADAGSELTITTHEIAPGRVLSEDFRFGGVRILRIPSQRGYTELSPGNFALDNAAFNILIDVEEVTAPISLTLSGNALYLVEIWQGEDFRGFRSVRTIPIAVGRGFFGSTLNWVALCLIALAGVIIIAAIITIRRKKR